MTDQDPAASRRTSKKRTPVAPATGTPAPRGASRAGDAPGSTPPSAATPPSSTALRDRWWWSPTLMIVVGLVVIGYQLEPLRSSSPVWGNWAVAALGLAVAVHGAVQLRRAHRSR